MRGKRSRTPAEKAKQAAATKRNKLLRIRKELKKNPNNVSAKVGCPCDMCTLTANNK